MLVIVDTSVWVQHIRRGVPDLASLLPTGDVVSHSVVIGELAVGGLRDRSKTLAELHGLLAASECTPTYVFQFLEAHQLFNIGLSWGDVQLLAVAHLDAIPIWSLDQTLHKQAEALGLAWVP